MFNNTNRLAFSNHQHEIHLGIVFMAFSALFVALVTLLGKQLSTETNISTLIFLRFAGPMLVLSTLALLCQWKIEFKPHLKWHLIRGLFSTLCQYSLFYVIFNGSLLPIITNRHISKGGLCNFKSGTLIFCST